MSEVVETYRLTWETVGHQEVKGEAERVDKALDAVATSVEAVTRRTDAGKTSADAYSRRSKALADALGKTGGAADKATTAFKTNGAAASSLGRDFAAADREAGRLEKSLTSVSGRLRAATTGAQGLKTALAAAVGSAGIGMLIELGEEGGAMQAVTHRLREVGVSADDTNNMITRLGGGSVASVETLISRAETAGVAFDDMRGLADAALQVSIQRGEAAGDVFEKLVGAVASGRQGYLKQLGITLDLATAEHAYAESIGKTRGELSTREKKIAASKAAVDELNAAFAGGAPDAYASNISAVRDAFTDLHDEIARFAGDAMSDLGAVIGMIRNGGEANFASDNRLSRRAASEAAVKELEGIEARLARAKKRGEDVGDVVLALQDQIGEQRFQDMLGLTEPADRISAGYINALGRVQRAIEAERANLSQLTAAEDAARQAREQAAAAAEAEAKAAAEAAKAEEQRERNRAKRRRDAAREAAARRSFAWSLVDREHALFEDNAEREKAILEERHVRELELFDERAERREADAADRSRLLAVQDAEMAALVARIDEQQGGILNALLGVAQDTVGQFVALGEEMSGWLSEDDFSGVLGVFEQIGERASEVRETIAGALSLLGVVSQVGALESQNAIQRAKNRERDAKGEKERLAAQKAVLAAERAAERERRRFQAVEFALKAADNVGAAIEETAKAAGSYPDPVGIALHGFAALKHTAAAVFYGRGAVAAASAPSAVGAGTGGGGSAVPPAPSSADRPSADSGNGTTHTTVILNGVMADNRSVRTALTDGLNTVGDGQIPVEEAA